MDDALEHRSIDACPRQPQHRQWTRLREGSTGSRSLSGGVGNMLADEFDFDYLRLDNDSPDLPLDQVAIAFWRFRVHAAVLAQVGSNGAEDCAFDLVRRHA